MKFIVLGLFSLSLLGFVCAQMAGELPEPKISNATSKKNTTNINNNSTGTSPISTKPPITMTTKMTGTRPAGVTMATMTTKSAMTTKSGQSRIFTSVSLLFFSSCVHHALWQ